MGSYLKMYGVGMKQPKISKRSWNIDFKWQGKSWQLKTPEISRGTVELPGIVITALNRCLNKEVYAEKLMISETVTDEWPCVVINPGP